MKNMYRVHLLTPSHANMLILLHALFILPINLAVADNYKGVLPGRPKENTKFPASAQTNSISPWETTELSSIAAAKKIDRSV